MGALPVNRASRARSKKFLGKVRDCERFSKYFARDLESCKRFLRRSLGKWTNPRVFEGNEERKKEIGRERERERDVEKEKGNRWNPLTGCLQASACDIEIEISRLFALTFANFLMKACRTLADRRFSRSNALHRPVTTDYLSKRDAMKFVRRYSDRSYVRSSFYFHG